LAALVLRLGLGLGLGLGDPLVPGVADDVVEVGVAGALLIGLVPGLGLRVGLGLGEEVALALLVGVVVALALDVGARVAALGPGAAIDADRTSVLTHPCGAAPRTAAVSLVAQGFTVGGGVGWLARNMPTMPEKAREIPTATLNAGYVARCVLMD
jgi:hypothetical protein